MALWNALIIPKLFQICKCFINRFLLSFLIFAKIGFVTNFVYVLQTILLSRDGSWMRLALLRSFLSFLNITMRTFCQVCAIYFWGLDNYKCTLWMRLVLIIIFRYVFKMKAFVPAAFLYEVWVTFSLILLTMAIWLRDLLRDILVTESSDWVGLW